MTSHAPTPSPANCPTRRIVLLRGLMREAGHWGDWPARLQQAMHPCDVLTPDLPGNGQLWRTRSPTLMADMLQAVRVQVQQAWGPGCGPVDVVAISMGGMLATWWAHAHPDEVRSLCLMSSSMRPHSPLTDRLRPAQWPQVIQLLRHRKDARAWERTILGMTTRQPVAPTVLDEWVSLRMQRPVSTANAWRQLWAAARFRAPKRPPVCPTLVMYGAEDALVSPRCSQALARAWQCALAMHPAAGHDLPLDAPEWTLRTVQAWLTHTATPHKTLPAIGTATELGRSGPHFDA